MNIYKSLKITTIPINSMVEVLNHPPPECHFYDCQWFVITTFCPIFTILQVDYHHLPQLLSPGVNSYISYSVPYFTDISICTYSSPLLIYKAILYWHTKSTTPGRAACNSNSPQGCTYFVISVINGLSVISQEHKVQIFVSESSFPVHCAVLPASGNIPGHIPYFHWLSSWPRYH